LNNLRIENAGGNDFSEEQFLGEEEEEFSAGVCDQALPLMQA
jgi:hypothetical protein